MYGYNKSYAELLEESGLQTLKSRRESALLRFANNCLTNPNYQHWFRENQNPRCSQRNPTRFEEKLARTSRLYNSPLYTARRALNATPFDPPDDNTRFDHNLNDPFAF